MRDIEAYRHFTGQLEMAYDFEPLRREIEAYYPMTVQLMDRFVSIGHRLYGDRGPRSPISLG